MPPSSGGGSSTSSSVPEPPGAGLSGLVVRRTDVASLPERPITVGSVVIVPAGAVESFWKAMSFPATGPPVPGKAEFLVDPNLLPRAGVVVRIEDGRFSSGVAPDGALLCLADDLPGDEQGPPYHVTGCARYDGGGDRPREVRLSSGFGGVMVRPL